MNSILQSHLFAKTIGLLGAGAFVALTSLPGVAQTNMNSTQSSGQAEESVAPNSRVNDESPADSSGATPTNPAYGNPGISRNDTQAGEDSTEQGPSIIPGESRPGASETPSGSPSVPGTSQVDDPGMMQNDSTVERDALNSPSSSTESGNIGPSAVPSETIPGPSETPSGSPSVPSVSTYDDPSHNLENSNVEQDAMNTPDMMREGGDSNVGPSVVPGEGRPGASETPSGSPSVPGTSGVDDPGQRIQ